MPVLRLMRPLSPRSIITILLVLLPLSVLLALMAGPVWMGLWGEQSLLADESRIIVEQIRIPRMLMAAIIGAVLAASGVLMQGLFRNPLADPSLIGVSSGASAGASFIIVIAAPLLGMYQLLGVSLVAFGAFIGAILATALVYQIAARKGRTAVATMLLAGIAISALAGAINSFLSYIADNFMLRQISLWQMGSLGASSWPKVWMAYGLLLPLLFIFMRYRANLDALLLGESQARFLGVDVARLKRDIIVWVALAVGVAVALSGTIAFVGLVVPHILRLLIGPGHRALLPASCLAGAILLLWADAFSRFVLSPAEIPIGVVTALLGAPFFLSLLSQRQYRQGA